MNRLDQVERAKILHLLCESMSIRAITRLTGVSKTTASKLVVDAGQAAACVEGFEAEVVENEHIGAAEGFDEARMAPSTHGEIDSGSWMPMRPVYPTPIRPCAISISGNKATPGDAAGGCCGVRAAQPNPAPPKVLVGPASISSWARGFLWSMTGWRATRAAFAPRPFAWRWSTAVEMPPGPNSYGSIG